MVLTEALPTGFRPDGRPQGTIGSYLTALTTREQNQESQNPDNVSVDALSQPGGLFSWFLTTQAFSALYIQEAVRTFSHPFPDKDLKGIKTLLAAGLHQEMAYRYLKEWLKRKDPAGTLLSPMTTLMLYKRLFPKAPEKKINPFKPPSLDGIAVPDGVMVKAVRGNRVTEIYEYALRAEIGQTEVERLYGLRKDKYSFPNLFLSSARLVFVTPRTSSYPIGGSRQVDLLRVPYGHDSLRSFVESVWANFRPREDSARLQLE